MPDDKTEPNQDQSVKKPDAVKQDAPGAKAPADAKVTAKAGGKPAQKQSSQKSAPKKAAFELPLATVIRIAKKNGAERVGEDAAQILAEIGEAYIGKIVKGAMTYAKVAGRKTLKKDDLDIVLKQQKSE